MSDYTPLSCFKAYDARGKVPEELNADIAYKTGRAFVEFLDAKTVIVGRDIRATGPELEDALIRGLTEAGADVKALGVCGTETVYFATSHLQADGGIMITASHNPPQDNGMKFVREGAKPISEVSGLKDIERMISIGEFKPSTHTGNVEHVDVMDAYIKNLLSYIDLNNFKPLKIVVNAGNGGAGMVIDRLEKHLPFQFIKVHHEPDGSFPNGVPNPLILENRADTAEVVKAEQADAGIAWDGDFDRCFFFDENGDFIEGYYLVGFLAKAILEKYPGGKIVYDPRLTWNTIEIVNELGGTPVMSVSGHAFIKQKMREEKAVYGGEMSAHHYFKDFTYCDSGMLPWLLVLEIMCKENKKLSALVKERIEKYPCSGEINHRVKDPDATIDKIQSHFASQHPQINTVDGVSM
ncbi:phosphomannomutase, partial [bacterium]|nr:phosphomannomutase [bacterium]